MIKGCISGITGPNKAIAYIAACVMLLLAAPAKAQSKTDTSAIKDIVSRMSAWHDALPAEQLYLHFDKPYYAAGDTAWVKAYIMMGADHHASAYSAKLYVELLDNGNKLVQRLVLPVFDGLAQGFIPLTEKQVPEGSYTLRAYTNWQQNFGAGAFYYRQFYVGKLGGKTWLVTEQNRSDNPTDTNHIQLAMRFTDAKGLPLVTRRLNIRVLENGKAILKSEMATGVDGTLNGGFSIPAKANRRALSIAVEDVADKDQHITFPFYPSGSNGDIDLQFMPEGGSLVAGLYNKVGFKAVGEDGLGRDITGIVTDSKGEEAATLQSLHNGMGSFVLVPQAGETYTARIMLNGKEKKYTLPAARAQGMALRVDGVTHDNEVYVYISATAADSKPYTLVARSNNAVYWGSGFSLNEQGYYNTRIPKNKFGTGIVSLSIIGPDSKLVCTRNVFIDRHDALQISTVNAKGAYNPGDSVAINFYVADANNAPVQGSFSVSVTDDMQVKYVVQPNNIRSHILLTSELKGNIEDPAWYFQRGTDTDNKLKEKALDNLLLTQGWQGFDLEKINTPLPEPAYKPEPDIRVSGKLTNLFNKPAPGLSVTLLSKGKAMVMMDTLSDNNGRFIFKDLPITDTAAYAIKLHTAKGKTAAAGISIDEFKPTGLPLAALPAQAPWNLNTDTTLINYINKARQRNYQDNIFNVPKGTTLLKQVEIKDTRPTKMIGFDMATEVQSIDTKTLLAANKTTLMDLLNKELKGTLRVSDIYAITVNAYVKSQQKGTQIILVHDGIVKSHGTRQFVLGTVRINDIVVDGQSLGVLTQSLRNQNEAPPAYGFTRWGNDENEADQDFFERAKTFFNMLSAEDVTSIKVFRGNYVSIVITTRSGNGLSTTSSIGTYAYRPLPMQLPRQFYSPKYTVQNKQPDLRSTIHWDPNLITDAAGNAKLSFYAGDKPSTYTVVIEGTDMQGHFGVSTGKINVTQGAAAAK